MGKTSFAGWIPWSPWTECSKSCENGTRLRDRICQDDNGTMIDPVKCPSPTITSESEECNVHGCPGKTYLFTEFVNLFFALLVWTTWLPWSHCNVSCGNGSIYRTRICESPNGTEVNVTMCSTRPDGLTSLEYKDCNMFSCPGMVIYNLPIICIPF